MNAIKKCEVCGVEFKLLSERHYIAIDCGESGIGAVLGKTTDPQIYDAIDCPFCGSQNILKKRKRRYIEPDVEEKTNDADQKLYDENRCV